MANPTVVVSNSVQKVVVVDGNNLIVRIDRGVAGRSVTDVVPVEIDNSLYLEFYFSDGTTETVGPVGTIQYIGQSPIVVTGSTISLSTVPVNLGGTGATTASGARTNLGLGTISTQDASAVAITGGSITGITDLAIADGGTGASTASGARTNLGLGTIATQDASNVSITGGSITGITDLAIADGGTGASTASGARSNLGLGTAATLDAGVANGVATLDSGGTVPLSQIPASIQGGVSYQGTWNASTNTPTLSSGVGSKGYYYVVSVAGNTNLDGITSWNVGDWAIYSGTAWQKIDNTDAVTSVNGYTGTVVLTNTDISGFGTMSTQNANNVSITGGSISGITDLAVADGGTGASTASGARTNLGAAASGANSDIISMSGITGGISTVDYVGFDTTYTTALTAGQLGWDGNNTLGLGMAGGNVIQKIGEDQFYYVKASSAITKGQVIMLTGAVGASGVITAAPAASVTDGFSILGIAAENIAVNAFGLIQFEGTLRGFDTSAFTDGDTLYYNPLVTGGLTATKPSAPNVKVQVCVVINAGNGGNGSVLIRVSPGSVLGGTDSNVQFGTLANGNLIQYDSTLQYWKNVAPSTVAVTTFSGGTTGLTPSTATAGVVTLAGTLGIGNGGTGQTTANAAFNALAPDQTGNSGKYLTTDGSNTSWATNPLGTVTSVSGTGTVSGISLSGTVTTSGSLTLGGSLDLSAPPAIGGTTPAAGAFTTLSASSDLTLSGGSANGVLYLNGSKVATAGSALTFDGSSLGIGGAATSRLMVKTATDSGSVTSWGASQMTVSPGGGGTDTAFGVGVNTSTNDVYLYALAPSVAWRNMNYNAANHIYNISGSEQMRLTSTGLGIGTSSPAQRLHVQDSTANNGTMQLGGTTYYGTIKHDGVSTGAMLYNIATASGAGHQWQVGGTTLLNLTQGGNLGLGVTPSAWGISAKAFQFGGYSYVANSGGNDTVIGNNAYNNGAGPDRYINTGYASRIYSGQSTSGGFVWNIAPSGTAGSTISYTQAMTLTTGPELLVNCTSTPSASVSGAQIANPLGTSSKFSCGSLTSSVAHIDFINGNGTVGSISTNGTLTSYNVTSDQRLKENIVDAPEFGSVIDSIKVRSYDWKADGNHQRAGFVAQELVTVAPEAVHQPADPEEMMAVDYSKLVPMLVKEIQSLRARVAQLESN